MSQHAPSFARTIERRELVCGSDAQVIMQSGVSAMPPLSREKRGEAEPEDLCNSLIARFSQPTTSAVRAAHAEFVATLAGHLPRPIPLSPCALDLEDRAAELKELLGALAGYLGAVLDDTAQNVPGGLELRSIDALLCDLVSEVTGTLRQAAAALPSPGRRA